MIIQIDTREHKFELARVQRQIEKQGASTFVKKLDVGDYMNVEVPDLSIDRKKNLQELCSNVCQQHERFRRELVRANKMGIQLIILIEHGGDINCLEDVYFWDNPRLKKSPRNGFPSSPSEASALRKGQIILSNTLFHHLKTSADIQ